MELIYSDLNSIFDMSVIFIANYFLVGDNVPIDIKTFLTTNFVNLKIKPVQFFKCAYKDKLDVYIFIR
jgi:hypothetical protein